MFVETTIADKVLTGERISASEALALYQNEHLTSLGALAHARRLQTVPGNEVTYLIDRNINYTNVCNTDCSFCGFYRRDPNDPESYTLSLEEIGQKIEEALSLGATRILLQGGHNDELPYSFYPEMISSIASRYDIEINSFSPSEIHQMHLVSQKSYAEILADLKESGMRGLPGGGAELLVEEIRMKVSPKKITGDLWLSIMGDAQRLGLTTTATMVIGFGEALSVRIEHLENVRNHQDMIQAEGHEGFGAFISWGLQHNENTSMGRSRHSANYGADGMEYLRNLAVSRIFLDNVPHHASSWPTYGTTIGKMALHFGADDFGSTMMEENVVSQAGALTQSKWAMSPQELETAIKEAGFNPVQRYTNYTPVSPKAKAA